MLTNTVSAIVWFAIAFVVWITPGSPLWVVGLASVCGVLYAAAAIVDKVKNSAGNAD